MQNIPGDAARSSPATAQSNATRRALSCVFPGVRRKGGKNARSNVRKRPRNSRRAGARETAETGEILATRGRFWAPSLMIPRAPQLQGAAAVRCYQFTTIYGAV